MAGKGSGFEREVSVLLSYWWTEGENDDVFWRVAASGGRATNRRKAGKKTVNMGGDITFTDPVGEPLIRRVSLELKRGYKNWSVQDVLDRHPTRMKALQEFEKFLQQSTRDAAAENKEPMIIFKKDQRVPCIVMQSSFVASIAHHSGRYTSPRIDIRFKGGNWTIFVLDDFLEWCDPSVFKDGLV